MKQILILGAGTAGTMVANHLHGRLPEGWQLTVIDPEEQHLYQPGLLFIPFGADDEKALVRSRRSTLKRDIKWLQAAVASVDAEARKVVMENGDRLDYDILVLATGSQIRPEETEGLLGPHWRQSVFDFYTLEGARALRTAMAQFERGRLVVNVVEMPIKCPVAPLEFLFLADAFFTERGIRDQVDLIYATPLDGAFTKPIAARQLGGMLEDKGIQVETEFNTGSVDGEGKVLQSWDEREIPYDLLVVVPTHGGASFVERSGLGNELGFVPTDPQTLQSKHHGSIFVLGDATDLPSSKAGSVAHFQSGVVADNVLRLIEGGELRAGFDGHANCFVESGHGKGLLIDFNYDTEPLPGTYPVPAVGPFTLLKESRRNHWGKHAFRWLYWNFLLPTRWLPIPNRMSMWGKKKAA